MMTAQEEKPFVEQARARLAEVLSGLKLLETDVSVRVGILTPEEAIGKPVRQDFPIMKGKERVLEARFLGARGHSFTDSPCEFKGTAKDLLDLPLQTNRERAMFVAALNAVFAYLGEVDATVHCRDTDPERCGPEIAQHVRDRWGEVRVGLIGHNPAIAEALVAEFGAAHVLMTDLDPDNVGTMKFGVEVWDGSSRTEDIVRESGVVVVTGSTMVNGTFDEIWRSIRQYDRDYLVYGVTGAGMCHLFGLERICPYGAEGSV